MLTRLACALPAGLLWAVSTAAAPPGLPPTVRPGLMPAAAMPSPPALPALRPPPVPGAPSLPPPLPLAPDAAAQAASALRRAMAREVPGLLRLRPGRPQQIASRARAMLAATHTVLEGPQLVVVVDRAPGVQTLALMMAQPGDAPWILIGAAHVSTGQAGRTDYYITPVGVFAHTAAILDFRALGTYNEHHVRGLGLAGMRVWDFGWQWALKGWHTDGAGGDIRLQMHATDPVLLEPRLGRPASEGCVRVSSAMNRFLDDYGVLDADVERAATDDLRYRSLLRPGRTPSPLAGRLLIVIDDRDPVEEAPTQASRPAGWPAPPESTAGAAGSL